MQFLKFMAYKADYLTQLPSHHAAVVCILTVNLFACRAALELGLARSEQQVEDLKKQLKTGFETEEQCPLAMWTPAIEELTHIKRSELTDLYSNLIQQLDSKQFKNQLTPYPELWPKGSNQ